MKIRTLLAGSTTLAVAALSAATLAPVASHAASASSHLKPVAGCAVTLDGPNTQGTLTAPVIKSAALAHDPANPAFAPTLGYHVATTSYAGSAAFEGSLAYTAPGSACGSLSVVTYGVQGGTAGTSPLQSRTVSLAGQTSPLSLHSLIADVPAGNDTDSNGPCLAFQIEIRDTNGNVVQVAPTTAPLVECPGGGGGFPFGG